MLLNRLRPSYYMAGFCLAWSIVSLLTYLANSYATMVVCRLLLGITEAPVSPLNGGDMRMIAHNKPTITFRN